MDQIRLQGLNIKKENKDIAFYENKRLFGFEELMRTFILRTNAKGGDDLNCSRDFTCVCTKNNSEVLFFGIDQIVPILKVHKINWLKEFYQERRDVL
mgnify:CR=1 FL=1